MSNNVDELIVGNDYLIPLTFSDASGNPVDLTGGTAYWRLCDADGNTVLDTSSPSAGIVFTDAVNGAATLTLTRAQTLTLIANDLYDWELFLVDSASQNKTYESGTLKAKPSKFETI